MPLALSQPSLLSSGTLTDLTKEVDASLRRLELLKNSSNWDDLNSTNKARVTGSITLLNRSLDKLPPL